MTLLDYAASEQVKIFICSKNLSCRVVQQGNVAILSPLPGVSQGLKGSNSTEVSDSPWDQAFQQVRVHLRWIHCELLGCLVCLPQDKLGHCWMTAHTGVTTQE